MGENTDISILEDIIDNVDSNSGDLTVQNGWGRIMDAYIENPGNPKYANLVVEFYDKIEGLTKNQEPIRFSITFQEKIKPEYDNLENNDQIPGVWSIANNLSSIPSDIQARVKQDIDEGKRRLVYKIVEKGCKITGIPVDCFGKVERLKEQYVVERLKEQYGSLRESIILEDFLLDMPDHEVDKAKKNVSLFQQKKEKIDAAIKKYNEERNEYEKAKEEYVKALRFYEMQKSRVKRDETQDTAVVPKKPHVFNYENHIKNIVSLGVDFAEITLKEIRETEEILAEEGLTAKYEECAKLLKEKEELIRAERTIETYHRKREEGNKSIKLYRNMIDTGNPTNETHSRHKQDISEVVLAWFDFPESREKLEKAVEIKLKDLDNIMDATNVLEITEEKRKISAILQGFDEYKEFLKDHIKEVEERINPDQEGLTFAAHPSIKYYDLSDLIEKIDDKEVKKEGGNFNYLAFHKFNPKKHIKEDYKEMLEELDRIRNIFKDKKGSADESVAADLEECIKMMSAFEIRVKANQCKKITVNEDEKKAKGEIDNLVKEAENYKAKFPGLVKFVTRVQDYIQKRFGGFDAEEPEEDAVPMPEPKLVDKEKDLGVSEVAQPVEASQTKPTNTGTIMHEFLNDNGAQSETDSSVQEPDRSLTQEDIEKKLAENAQNASARSPQPDQSSDEKPEDVKNLEQQLIQDVVALQNKPDRNSQDILNVILKYGKSYGISDEELEELKNL